MIHTCIHMVAMVKSLMTHTHIYVYVYIYIHMYANIYNHIGDTPINIELWTHSIKGVLNNGGMHVAIYHFLDHGSNIYLHIHIWKHNVTVYIYIQTYYHIFTRVFIGVYIYIYIFPQMFTTLCVFFPGSSDPRPWSVLAKASSWRPACRSHSNVKFVWPIGVSIKKWRVTTLMWVKQFHVYHPPVITIFIGGMFTIPKWVLLFYPHYQ